MCGAFKLRASLGLSGCEARNIALFGICWQQVLFVILPIKSRRWKYVIPIEGVNERV